MRTSPLTPTAPPMIAFVELGKESVDELGLELVGRMLELPVLDADELEVLVMSVVERETEGRLGSTIVTVWYTAPLVLLGVVLVLDVVDEVVILLLELDVVEDSEPVMLNWLDWDRSMPVILS